jgi:hypothetical protein
MGCGSRWVGCAPRTNGTVAYGPVLCPQNDPGKVDHGPTTDSGSAARGIWFLPFHREITITRDPAARCVSLARDKIVCGGACRDHDRAAQGSGRLMRGLEGKRMILEAALVAKGRAPPSPGFRPRRPTRARGVRSFSCRPCRRRGRTFRRASGRCRPAAQAPASANQPSDAA